MPDDVTRHAGVSWEACANNDIFGIGAEGAFNLIVLLVVELNDHLFARNDAPGLLIDELHYLIHTQCGRQRLTDFGQCGHLHRMALRLSEQAGILNGDRSLMREKVQQT